jgi:hypothetical protein
VLLILPIITTLTDKVFSRLLYSLLMLNSQVLVASILS